MSGARGAGAGTVGLHDSQDRRHGVLVVDDSAFMRKLIGEMISAEPAYRLVGFARDGEDAMTQLDRLQPDIVTLDLDMPRLNGLDVLARIMRDAPLPVVVLSAGGPQYGDATLRALELGAVDFVRKPSGPISLDLLSVRPQLISALDAAAATTLPPPAPIQVHAHGAGLARATAPAQHVVVIASSTGGPRALAEIIPALPADLPAAVVVAQHIPSEFTSALARRLDRASSVTVSEALVDEPLYSGRVYVARGGRNTRVVGSPGNAVFACDSRQSGSGAAPSADVLFASAASSFAASVTAVVLTGMGRDGADGLRAVRRAGGRAIVQDRESSAIYGMPRAALEDAGADSIAALSQIAGVIVEMILVSTDGRGTWLTA